MPEQKIDGERLRALRVEQGLTQEELAHRAGLSVATMPGLEGEKRPARDLTVKKLADALGVEADEFLKVPALG